MPDACVDAVHVGWIFFTALTAGVVGTGFGYLICLLSGDRIVFNRGE